MKVLVTGSEGQLGYELVRLCGEKNIDCIGVCRNNFDITDQENTLRFIEQCKPDVVVHCAAYTNVDKAENEKILCELVNVQGTKNIAEGCKNVNAKLVYVSTDYVFPGEGNHFIKVNEEINPINWYGVTKAKGEQVVEQLIVKSFIVRVSWVFGNHGNNFVKTMLRLGEKMDKIRVVDDQIGSPTYAVDLAEFIVTLLDTDKYGIYHATNEGVCSWAEFAEEIFKQSNIGCHVEKINSEEYPTIAKRPHNSRLDKSVIVEKGFKELPSWKDALHRFLNEK